LLNQELIFNGQILKNHLTLVEYGIREGSVIRLNVVNNQKEEALAIDFENDQKEERIDFENDQKEVENIPFNGKSIAYINPNQLHPKYDYDFSYIVDRKKYYRGGLIYRRPC